MTVSEAIRLQGEARTFSGEDDLRLDVERPEEGPSPGPSRTALITLVAVGLIAALGFAAYSQVNRQMQAAAQDAAPPPAEPAPVLPTAPAVSAAPIPAEPPLITPAAGAADAQTSEAQPAKDAPPEAAAKADAAEPDQPALKTEPVKTAKASEEVTPKPPKAAEAAAAKPAAKAGAADIPHLRSKLNNAYAEAQKAGVPKSVLKARQAEWKVLYAKAHQKSPEAVAALYKVRATQLEALAKKHHSAPG